MNLTLKTRNRLIKNVMQQYERDLHAPPVVQLDEFFDGNWDEKSIAPNQAGYGRPQLARVYEILSSIHDREDVQDVLVSIHECPDADEPLDENIWVSGSWVYILTSQSQQQVESWTHELAHSGVLEGWMNGNKPKAAPKARTGFNVFAVVWD